MGCRRYRLACCQFEYCDLEHDGKYYSCLAFLVLVHSSVCSPVWMMPYLSHAGIPNHLCTVNTLTHYPMLTVNCRSSRMLLMSLGSTTYSRLLHTHTHPSLMILWQNSKVAKMQKLLLSVISLSKSISHPVPVDTPWKWFKVSHSSFYLLKLSPSFTYNT